MPRGWTATRARILARDGERCTGCGAAATEVHHMQPGVEADELLTSLCHECHAAETAKQAAESRRMNAP